MIKLFQTTLSLLAAGSILFCGGGAGKVKNGVRIDGVDIGGLTYCEAESRVRENFPPASFCLEADQKTYSFPLDFKDNVSLLVRRAKRGENLRSEVKTEWVNAESDIEQLCRKVSFAPTDACVRFTREGKFEYTPEKDGKSCLYEETLQGALAALREGRASCPLATRSVKAKITMSELKKRTRRLASFTTYYDGANTARCHNIALACTRISGTELPAGGKFSFNEKVGRRTQENGFEVANVILDGEFVPGVGGGVCQVSTTLMNCALRAGLRVTNSRPHSLSVSYVPPSCDAMVSDYSDLEFVNPYPYPVYIAAQTGNSYVRFTVYGMPDGKRYELESNVILRVTPPPDKIEEGEEDKVVRAAKEGIASESYLLVYEGNTLVQRTLFRRDTYAVVQGIRQIKKTPPPSAEGPGEEKEPSAEEKIT